MKRSAKPSMGDTLRILGSSRGSFVLWLLLGPMTCISSLLFTLSLEPVIRAGINGDVSALIFSAAAAAALAVLDMLMSLALSRSRMRLLQSAACRLRRDMMEALLSGSGSRFTKKTSAEHTSDFTNSIERLRRGYLFNCCRVYESLWSLLASMAVLIFFSPLLALFLAAVGLVSVYIPSLFEKKLQEKQNRQLKASGRHLGLLRDIFCGYWIIRKNLVEKQFMEKYARCSVELAERDFKSEYCPCAVSALSEGISALAFVGITGISAWLTLKGSIAPGMILSISQLIGGVLVPMEELPRAASEIKGTEKLFASVLSAAECEGEDTPESAPELPEDWREISLSGLSYCYEGQEPVFENLELNIKRGGKYLLVGPSGSGKSSLAKLICGIYPGKFTLRVDGREEPKEIFCRSAAYMDQEVFLFNDSIYENISLYRGLSREKIKEGLRRMNFSGRLADTESLPELKAGEEGSELSGGERQRIALMRELMGGKRILVLDEYSSSLDSESSLELEKLIMGMEDISCIFISHHADAFMLDSCDCIFTLRDGKLGKSSIRA